MSWIDRRLDELANEGHFDGLPGSGRPIGDLDEQYAPTWWAARWIKRDAARQDADAMRRRLDADVVGALELPRPKARERLREIRDAITELNKHLDSAQQLPSLDVDLVLIRREWGP